MMNDLSVLKRGEEWLGPCFCHWRTMDFRLPLPKDGCADAIEESAPRLYGGELPAGLEHTRALCERVLRLRVVDATSSVHGIEAAIGTRERLCHTDDAVQPILHPAVPEASTRLRFFLTSDHTEDEIRRTVEATAEELAKLGRS